MTTHELAKQLLELPDSFAWIKEADSVQHYKVDSVTVQEGEVKINVYSM